MTERDGQEPVSTEGRPRASMLVIDDPSPLERAEALLGRLYWRNDLLERQAAELRDKLAQESARSMRLELALACHERATALLGRLGYELDVIAGRWVRRSRRRR